jgi:hypothetical protein
VRGENYVCLEHRIASRMNYIHGSKHCPVDGAEMISLGTKWRIPKKGDDVGWRGVAKFIREMKLDREGRYSGPLRKMYDADEFLKRWRKA